MSFYEPKDLSAGDRYKLTEIVEGTKVSAGDYFLVSIDESEKKRFPAIGFSKVKNGKAEIFLIEAHAQFGSSTWRRAFRHDNHWEIYFPAGGITWNFSYVIVERVD